MFPTAGSLLIASGDAITVTDSAITTPSSVLLSDIYNVCLDIREFIFYIFLIVLIYIMYKAVSTAFKF